MFKVITPTNDAYLYDRDYFNGYYVNDKKREAMYRQEYQRILKRSNFGNVLDIGCGVGGFLETFDDRWEKYGYEPSEFAAERAAKKGIRQVRIETLDFESMDVVILRGSLQHINYPMQTLNHATRVLKKGGLLCILATPDTDSLVYKIFGQLPALDAPRNWVVFGSKVLVNILKRLGYENVEVLRPYLGTPYANPLKDAANFLLSLLFGYRKFAWPGNQIEIYAVKK